MSLEVIQGQIVGQLDSVIKIKKGLIFRSNDHLKDELLTKMSNHLLPEYQTPRENWYWAKEWNDGQKYDRPDGHWDAARPEKISQSDKAILDRTEELVVEHW